MFPIVLGIVLGLYALLRCSLWMFDNRNTHTPEWRDARLVEWIQRELTLPPLLSDEDPSHPAFEDKAALSLDAVRRSIEELQKRTLLLKGTGPRYDNCLYFSKYGEHIFMVGSDYCKYCDFSRYGDEY